MKERNLSFGLELIKYFKILPLDNKSGKVRDQYKKRGQLQSQK
jgi:hypothetical protein